MKKNPADEYEKFRKSSAGDPEFKTHRDDPSNKWEKRVSASVKPRVPASNAQNLFDDSDHVDSRWFKLAKKHLSQWKSRR